MATAAAVTSTQRHLRVAMLWNGAIQGEETLDVPRPVTLGGKLDTFYLPDGVSDTGKVQVLEPTGHGYRLRVDGRMGGQVWLSGVRTAINQLASQGAVTLGPDDYGVVTVGPVAVFFQHVRAARRPSRQLFTIDGAAIAAFGLSLFMHSAALILMLLARREMPDQDDLELPADLLRKFMVTPPPEDILEEQSRQSGTDTEDPGLRDRDEAGGKKAEGEEGRVGEEHAKQENTEIAGENHGEVIQKVRTLGLLGALNGPQGNAIDGLLTHAPNVSDLLSGLGSARTVLGRGSGGMGLRGVGSGGGGTGPGVLFGAGNMGSGVGAGRGSGLGRGSGGIGVRGHDRGEVRIAMTTAAPRVNGYLSAEQINRVVRANSAAIRYCYEVEVQRQPNLRGRIEIQWRINLQGGVTMSRVDSTTMNNPRVEGCMVRQIRRWTFPQPDGGEVVVTYPFIFGVSGG